MKNYPPLTIFDEHETPIGEASLEEIHAKGLRHKAVIVVVYDIDNRILLQRRGMHVATNPNKWDVSAAGHVDIDEDYQDAAYRELYEEIGLRDVKLKETAHYYTESITEGRKLNRFIKIYKTTVPPETNFNIDTAELSEIKWFSIEDLKTQLEKSPQEFNHDFNEVLTKISVKDENHEH